MSKSILRNHAAFARVPGVESILAPDTLPRTSFMPGKPIEAILDQPASSYDQPICNAAMALLFQTRTPVGTEEQGSEGSSSLPALATTPRPQSTIRVMGKAATRCKPITASNALLPGKRPASSNCGAGAAAG